MITKSRNWGWCCLVVLASACSANNSPDNNKSIRWTDDGQSQAPIIGGQEATDYAEAALVNMTRPGQSAICSGAVIAPRVVLTAGHCVAGWSGWEVVAPNAGGETVGVTEARVYDYTDTSGYIDPDQHDIAVLILSSEIQIDYYPLIADAPVPDGTEIVNIGRIDNGVASHDALFVSPAVAVSDATSMGFPYHYTSAAVTQPGDSGGPDLLPGAAPRTIVAVNSGGNDETQILARVDLLHDWIQEQIVSVEDPVDTDPQDDPPGDTCSDVGSSGACIGDVMTFCADGELLEYDCASFGLSCVTTAGNPGCG